MSKLTPETIKYGLIVIDPTQESDEMDKQYQELLQDILDNGVEKKDSN
jgi:hypothetical protein